MATGASLSDLTTRGKQITSASLALEKLVLETGEISVWQVRLDLDAQEVMKCAENLSGDELLRARRYRFEADRRRFVVARGLLRRRLAVQLNESPAALAFRYARSGKPYLDTGAAPVYFNVSHSEERALIATSGNCQLGVDIEYLNRPVECEKLARRFFTENECAALMNIPPARRKQAFLSCWTRKEAVAKALGDGLSMSFRQFEIAIDPDDAPRIIAPGDDRIDHCTLYDQAIETDYVASIAAYRGPPAQMF